MDPAPDLTVVLLGNAGAGKSASGNTILGRRAFESRRAFTSVTRQISEQTETTFGKRISVIDTPVILGREKEIQTRCQDLLQSCRPRLFLVVVKVDRFTIEQKNAVDAALRVIGKDEFPNCYLLFTGGDDLQNMSLEDFINEDPEGPLPQVFQSFGGRHHLFNNENGGPDQVRQLLLKSGHLVDGDRDRTLDRRLVLLGLPGGGKSSSGNTILGSDQFRSGCDFDAVSKKAISKSATVEGRGVTVVDTPGFTDQVLSPRKLFDEIMGSVLQADPGPHAFIITVRIGRISILHIKMFELLHKLFGSDALKYAMVLFTYEDELKGKTIEELIESNKHVSDLVSKCGGRYCVFDNRKRGNRVQVRHLLDIVDQMVTGNDGGHYTLKMLEDTQTFLTKLWREVCDWFIQLLREVEMAKKKIQALWKGPDSDTDSMSKLIPKGFSG